MRQAAAKPPPPSELGAGAEDDDTQQTDTFCSCSTRRSVDIVQAGTTFAIVRPPPPPPPKPRQNCTNISTAVCPLAANRPSRKSHAISLEMKPLPLSGRSRPFASHPHSGDGGRRAVGAGGTGTHQFDRRQCHLISRDSCVNRFGGAAVVIMSVLCCISSSQTSSAG